MRIFNKSVTQGKTIHAIAMLSLTYITQGGTQAVLAQESRVVFHSGAGPSQTGVGITLPGGNGNTASAPSQQSASYLKRGVSPVGLVLLSEHTGIIYACAATTSASALASPPGDAIHPIGKCAEIGAIPTTTLSGNGFVSMSFNGTFNIGTIGVGIPYGVAFVGNLATGYIAQCTYQYVPTTGSGPTGEIFGSCLQVTNVQ
jgi:hypothetical protein